MDASGNNMDIIGSVEILVQVDGASLMQNFKVLGSNTYKHVLLGRNFLAKFASVEFDCQNNAVKLGKAWLKCESFTDKVPVMTQEKTLLSPRSESLVNVTCKKSLGMITADYEPVEIQAGADTDGCNRCSCNRQISSDANLAEIFSFLEPRSSLLVE